MSSETHDVTKFVGKSKYLMYTGGALAAGLIGGGLAWNSVRKCDWYDKLKKPCWTPPLLVGGLANTVSVFLLGWAAYAGAEAASEQSRMIINLLFALILILNLIWSYLVFQSRNLNAAAVVGGLLAVATLALLYFVWQADATAGIYLLPVLAWYGFMAVSTACIASMNPDHHHKKGHKKGKHSDSESSSSSSSDSDSSSEEDTDCSDSDDDHHHGKKGSKY